jgi:hypothetical protein
MSSGQCTRCGQPKKLLFTSWYCPCEEDAFKLIGWGIVDTLVHKYLDDPNALPVAFCLHLFRDKEVAKEFADAFLGFTLLRVDLTHEPAVFWSTKEKLWVHEARSILPCEVVH